VHLQRTHAIPFLFVYSISMTKADTASEAREAAVAALQAAIAKSKILAGSASQQAAVFAALVAKWSAELAQVAGPAVAAAGHGVHAAAIAAADGATAINTDSLTAAGRTWREHEPRNYVADGVIALLAARVLVALNAIGDAALHELLHSSTVFARAGLVVTMTQGWLAAYVYRGTLLRELPKDRSEQLQQIAKNSLSLPPVFWVSTALSGLVSLQASKELGSGAIRKVLQVRLRVLVLLFGAYMAMVPKAQERARRSLMQLQDSMPPEVARTLSTSWSNFQVATRWTATNAGWAAKAAASAAATATVAATGAAAAGVATATAAARSKAGGKTSSSPEKVAHGLEADEARPRVESSPPLFRGGADPEDTDGTGSNDNAGPLVGPSNLVGPANEHDAPLFGGGNADVGNDGMDVDGQAMTGTKHITPTK
jgi:hypothetical protein